VRLPDTNNSVTTTTTTVTTTGLAGIVDGDDRITAATVTTTTTATATITGVDDGSGHAVQEEAPELLDPQQAQHEAWVAAEGYTPLADFAGGGGGSSNMRMMMVSMGPGGSSSSDDEDDGSSCDTDRHDDYEDNGDRRPRGAFFVNPYAFGVSSNNASNYNIEDDNDDDGGGDGGAEEERVVSSGTDFADIAARALLALDKEYEQSLMSTIVTDSGTDATSSQNHHPADSSEQSVPEDDDVKIIAAAFDRRKEELERIKQQGGFPVNWEDVAAHCSTSTTTTTPFRTPKQFERNNPKPPADTDAVRKAIEALSVKHKDAPFLQKFAAWQQRQTQQQQHRKRHDLIPPAPCKAFYKSTPKAKQATANLTRSATLAEAMTRLMLVGSPTTTTTTTTALSSSAPRLVERSIPDGVLLVDIVGVDDVECKSFETIQTTFCPIVRWLGERKNLPFQQIRFRLIGRDLLINKAISSKEHPIDLLDGAMTNTTKTTSSSSSLKLATATCHSAVYHEFLQECEGSSAVNDATTGGGLSNMKTTPDLLVAFNAGIWGYQEWETTIRYLAQRPKTKPSIPMVITAYTLEECQEDCDVILKATTSPSSDNGAGASCASGNDERRPGSKILWEPEANPFGSKIVRETKSSNQEYRENAFWQAFLFGESVHESS
jgi:hypothetical protein